MLLVLAFLCSTSQAKVLILDGTLDFHKNLGRQKETRSNVLDKAIKNYLIENKCTEDKDQVTASKTGGDKCTRVSEDMSLSWSSISKLVRLGQKLNSQNKKKRSCLSIVNMVKFLIMTTW